MLCYTGDVTNVIASSMDVPKPGDTPPQAFTPYGQGSAPATSAHPETLISTNVAQGDEQYSAPGWSWGAFMGGPLFILGIRRYEYAWAYLVGFIPFIGPFAILAFMVFLGVKGREMAMTSQTFSNRDQYVGFMKVIDHGGKLVFLFTLAAVLLFMVLGFFMASAIPSMR